MKISKERLSEIREEIDTKIHELIVSGVRSGCFDTVRIYPDGDIVFGYHVGQIMYPESEYYHKEGAPKTIIIATNWDPEPEEEVDWANHDDDLLDRIMGEVEEYYGQQK